MRRSNPRRKCEPSAKSINDEKELELKYMQEEVENKRRKLELAKQEKELMRATAVLDEELLRFEDGKTRYVF